MPSVVPSPWLVEPLAKKHDRSDFSCGNERLDRYLKETATQDARRFLSAPFVAVNPNQPTHICGFYTLSQFGIEAGDLPQALARTLPRNRLIGTTLLGQLAVDIRYRGHGLGEFLLMDALHRAFINDMRSFAVVVDAIEQEAVDFYLHFEFIQFPNRPDRLFLPMKTIAAMFSPP